ncbi:MAG: RNA polymerase sigma-70 factor [Marinilabiliaceae bacterium]|nr:RNA polymerase sigma-70 factor [Marinilabiliaceae bacterium]
MNTSGKKAIVINKELLLRIQQDDKLAFFYLYNSYYKRLFGFILKFIKQELDTEEIVQEVFIKIWEERKNINTDSSFEGYLFTIAYNKTISLLRKRVSEQKYLRYLKSIQSPGIATDLMDEIYFSDLKEKVKDLIDELTPQQKIIYKLSREEGLPHKEIAERLNISENTVKKHITNILNHFRNKLEKK